MRENYIFKSLSEMHKLLNERNIKFIVAIYPDEFQINTDLLSKLFRRYDIKIQDYNIDLMQIVLKQYLEPKGIPYIDLLDDFRTKGQGIELYKFRDTHWNESGIELAANVLFRELLKMVDALK